MEKSKLWIVVGREVFTRIQKRSFLIMTILMPFIFAGIAFLPMVLAKIGDSGRQTVVIIDDTGHYAPSFKSNDDYLFVRADKMNPSYRSDTTEVDAVLMISSDLATHPNAAAIYSRREVSRELSDMVNDVLSNEVKNEKLRQYNIPALDNIIHDVEQRVEATTVRWTDDGEQESNSDIATGLGMALTFFIYMFVLSYGSMVMQGVMEEKTNRIVELMVSSVRPVDLLLGKIIGVGLVGLLQMLIWGILLCLIMTIAGIAYGIPLIASPDIASPAAGTDPEIAGVIAALSNLPIVEMTLLFALYFIGGYLLYAALLAALGSAVDDMQDSQQLMMPVIGIMLFAFYAGFYAAGNPDGPFAFWTSFIPFTSPIVMMARVPFGVPWYEELISLVLLYASSLGIIWMSAKIYRIGILMYGKKISFKEIIKWIRYN